MDVAEKEAWVARRCQEQEEAIAWGLISLGPSRISLGISLAISLGLHACMKGLRWTVVQICISFCDIHLNTAGLEAAAAGGCSAGADASQHAATTQGTCRIPLRLPFARDLKGRHF